MVPQLHRADGAAGQAPPIHVCRLAAEPFTGDPGASRRNCRLWLEGQGPAGPRSEPPAHRGPQATLQPQEAQAPQEGPCSPCSLLTIPARETRGSCQDAGTVARARTWGVLTGSGVVEGEVPGVGDGPLGGLLVLQRPPTHHHQNLLQLLRLGRRNLWARRAGVRGTGQRLRPAPGAWVLAGLAGVF